MRIYISGAVTGTCDAEERFKRVEEFLKTKGHEVVNPYEENKVLKNATYIDYMINSLKLLKTCDAIYMMRGHEKSKGATFEFCCALESDIPCLIFKG